MSESNGTGTITWTVRLDGGATPIFTTSNAGPTASFSWNTSNVTPGAHRLDLTAQDGNGRIAPTVTRNVTVGSPGPGAFFTSPAEGATVAGVVSVGMGRNTTTGTVVWTLNIDGTQAFTVTNSATTASFSWDTGPYTPGPHTLSLTVQDTSSGASSTTTRSVTVAGPLSASITTPTEGATVSGPVPVGMSESNGVGTISWTLRLDGGATPIFSTSNTGPTASFNWDTSAVPPGAHTLTLSVLDGAGRTATATRNVTVTPPTLTAAFTAPDEGATVGGPVTVGLSENNGTGTISWTVRLDGGATPIFSTSNAGPTASFTWDTSTVTAGAHRLDLTVQDGGGRTATATRNVTVQSGTIKVFITQPGTDDTTITAGSTVWVTCPASRS